MLVFVVPACTVATKKFEVKPGQLRNWSEELAQEEPKPYPFYVKYCHEGKNLAFLAIQHENKSSSSTFQVIENTLNQYAPEIIVLEGFSRSQGITPIHMIEWSKGDGVNGFFKKGETSFTIQKAVKLGIPFCGGEMDDVTLKIELLKAGYTEKDLLYFYFVRQLPQFFGDNSASKKGIKELFEDFTEKGTSELQTTSNLFFGYDDFLNWYKIKNHRVFRIEEIDSKITAPLSKGQFFTQRMSAAVGTYRDLAIVRSIAEMLSRYHRVLVVYGGSHWITQSKVFADWLGQPVEIQGFESSKTSIF